MHALLTHIARELPEETRVNLAADIYVRRQLRLSHPDGHTDNGGRWYPSDAEHCPCCASVRSPSRAFPWSYMTHCRTATHVAQLYNVPRAALLRAAKEHEYADQLGKN